MVAFILLHSYKFWPELQNNKEAIFESATHNIIRVAERLHKVFEQTGKVLHLDIESEPDGLLGNTQEVIQWYNDWLISLGVPY